MKKNVSIQKKEKERKKERKFADFFKIENWKMIFVLLVRQKRGDIFGNLFLTSLYRDKTRASVF